MNLQEAIIKNPGLKIFKVINSEYDDCSSWDVELVNEEILPEGENFYVIKARNIITPHEIIECYMDISMNERINDYAYFVNEGIISQKYTHECEGNVIPAIPIAASGIYNLFYSKIYPNIGIDILKKGVSVKKNIYIAGDLAYILRDEGQNLEAIKYFKYLEENIPSCCFIYNELAQLYKMENDMSNYEHYNSLFMKETNKNAKKGVFGTIQNKINRIRGKI